MRVNEPQLGGLDSIAVNARCDGYNKAVERYCREKYGFDLVSQLSRVAETEAWRTKHPVPAAREIWFPFVACVASTCLLLGLVLIRRSREHGRLSGSSAVVQ